MQTTLMVQNLPEAWQTDVRNVKYRGLNRNLVFSGPKRPRVLWENLQKYSGPPPTFLEGLPGPWGCPGPENSEFHSKPCISNIILLLGKAYDELH